MMKRVYDYFVQYYRNLSLQPSLEEVEQGIYSYLDTIELIDYIANDDDHQRIAERELARFKLMPYETFVLFFKNFSAREKAHEIVNECRFLAMNRVVSKDIISEEVYKNKMEAFYQSISCIAIEQQYSEWIRELTLTIKSSLDFAIGKTNDIPEDIIELSKIIAKTKGEI